ncbi:hypothetical protein Taro_040821 [Colocasia esculenta]|uniref:Uncharacterized protein n=1 Tax=Colocasia esculenta TaxID=4460 RepID=A0A843WVM4_COLES|nr:hypothetical protein [Colocasia esculenta]
MFLVPGRQNGYNLSPVIQSLVNQGGLILGPNMSFRDLLRGVFAWRGFSVPVQGIGARMWWNLFQQDDDSLLVHTSSSTYQGAVTLKYADWWASHAPAEPLLGSLLSQGQNVESMPPVLEARGGHSREDDVDDWDYELDVTDIPILNPNWDPSMENPEDPNFSIPFDDLIRMMEEPLPLTNQGTLQDITAAAEPTVAETTPFLFVEATPDQGNPLSALSSIALNEERNEPPTASHSVLDPSMPPEEIGILIEPLSQPAGPDEANFGATSPLNASEPDSSETCVISGDHSESTEPLSGETQQLSIAFEAACDIDEVSSHPSLVASGLDRSPQALGVLEARLVALRSEAVGTAGQISMVRDQHTSLLSTQREKSARASLLRMLASCLDRSVTEGTRHSVALAARLLSLEAEQSKIHATIAALEAEVDLLRASASLLEYRLTPEMLFFHISTCVVHLFDFYFLGYPRGLSWD